MLEAQLDIAKRAYERTQRLFAQQAATAQQLDQAERTIACSNTDQGAGPADRGAGAAGRRAHREQIAAARAQRQTAPSR